MKIIAKIEKHPIYFLIATIAIILTILSFILSINAGHYRKKNAQNFIKISSVEVSARMPVWGFELSLEDEIITILNGTFYCDKKINGSFSIVAFWKNPTAFESNWHIAKRRVGQNYVIAKIEDDIIFNDSWEFIIGGIEVDKDFSGDISVIAVAYPDDEINKLNKRWLDDNNGWGFEEIPENNRMFLSAPQTFNTTPNRE